MPRVDKEEQNAYMQEWRDQNREKVREYDRQFYAKKMADPEYRQKCYDRKEGKRRERRDLIKSMVMAEFQKNGCLLCDEKDSACLIAHHLDPNIKEFNIGTAIGRNHNNSVNVIAEELKKCVCLCDNCHCKVHANLLTIPSVA